MEKGDGICFLWEGDFLLTHGSFVERWLFQLKNHEQLLPWCSCYHKKPIKLARWFKPRAFFWAWGVPQPLQPWGRTTLRSETRGKGGPRHGDMVTWLRDGGCSVFVWKKSPKLLLEKRGTNFWCCHETFEWLFCANYITLWMLFFSHGFFKHLGWFKLWHDCPFQHPNKGSWAALGFHPPRSVRIRFPNRSHPAPRRRIVVPPKLMCSSPTLGWCRLAQQAHESFWKGRAQQHSNHQFPVMNQIRWKVNVWNTIILGTWFCLPPS